MIGIGNEGEAPKADTVGRNKPDLRMLADHVRDRHRQGQHKMLLLILLLSTLPLTSKY